MNYTYWNTNNIRANDMIVEIAKIENVDLFFLAEFNKNQLTELEADLEKNDYELFENPGCKRITIIKKKTINLDLSIQNPYYSVVVHKETGINVVSLHLPSQLWQSLDSLKEFMRDLRNNLDNEIGTSAEAKILLIGDFNVNPYESPMTHYDGFLCTNSPKAKHTINHLGKSRTTYYNPTWQLYSRVNFPGTKQFNRPSTTSYDVLEFHYLDQVVISQKLLESIEEESINVIENTKNFTFFNQEKNVIELSDHLPLIYKFKIKKNEI